MSKYSTQKNLIIKCFASAMLAVCLAPAFGLTQREPAMSIEQMAVEADEIITGNVLSQNTRIVANSFETDYEIQIHENLKSRSKELQAGSTFTITVPGGALQEPPLSQYVMGTSYMYKGEEVFLFLKKGSGKQVRLPRNSVAAGQVSKLTTTYRVVGLNQGRFDIVTLKDTGEKIVTRMNLENYGMVGDSTAVKEAMDAVAQKQIPTVMAEIARSEDTAAAVRDKDPLEFTATDGKKLKVEQSQQTAETMKALRQRKPVAQNLDSFKSQVQTFVSQNQ